MNWYMDICWGVSIPLFALLLIFAYLYQQEKKRFKKWQLFTIGVNNRARYKALKSADSLSIKRPK